MGQRVRARGARSGAADALLCFLLDVVPGTRVVAQVDDACEAIEAVPDGDVECLSKDAVALLRVGDDLRVASRYVEHHRILRASHLPAHLNIYVLSVSEGRAWKRGHVRPTQWFTPTRGLLKSSESVRATSDTDCSGAPIPGPAIVVVPQYTLMQGIICYERVPLV